MSKDELATVFNEYYSRLYRFARKTYSHDWANDIVVELFIKLYKDPRNVSDYPNFTNFIFLCLKNRMRSMWRSTQYKSYWATHFWGKEEIFESVVDPVEINMSDPYLYDNRREAILQAIQHLPQRQQEIIKLTLQDLKPAQIAKILHIEARTVHNHKCRATDALQAYFGEHLNLYLQL